MIRILSLVTFVGLVACGRPPGPHEDEFGEVTYWLVNESTDSRKNCSDGSGFEELKLDRIEYTPGIAWYFVYQLSADGRTATGMRCNFSSFNDCIRIPDRRLHVVGHEVTFTEGPTVLRSLGDCELHLRFRFLLTDNGPRGVGEERLLFEYEGNPDDCAALEAKIARDAPNGFGAKDCDISATHKAVFSHSRQPL